jgi:uncharacterized RDD family membrane protein YckC
MAKWWQRLVAFVIDLLILAVPNSIIISVIAGNELSAGVSGPPVGSTVWEAIGVALVVSLGYFSFLDGGRAGQTVGKMAVGIAVRDVDTGGAVGAGRALLRRLFFFATYIGLILFVLNALSPLWDARRRAWHDKLGRSCVVSVR